MNFLLSGLSSLSSSLLSPIRTLLVPFYIEPGAIKGGSDTNNILPLKALLLLNTWFLIIFLLQVLSAITAKVSQPLYYIYRSMFVWTAITITDCGSYDCNFWHFIQRGLPYFLVLKSWTFSVILTLHSSQINLSVGFSGIGLSSKG